MSKRDEKYLSDRIIREKIHKAARLGNHARTPQGERRAALFAIGRLVKRLNYSRRSYDRYFAQAPPTQIGGTQ